MPATYKSDHSRNHDLYRAFQIARLIALEALTLYEIAERLTCTPRTIRRAIYMLQDAGIDVMTAHLDSDDGEDLGAPIVARFRQMKVYKLDPRAWSAALYLPADGTSADGGIR